MGHFDYDSLADYPGAFLLPSDESIAAKVFVYTDGVGLRKGLSSYVHDPIFRKGPVVATGKAHKLKGTIQGRLEPRNEDGTVGTEVGARDWMERLMALYDEWADGNITLELQSRWLRLDSFAFVDEPDCSLLRADAWSVSIPWAEL